MPARGLVGPDLRVRMARGVELLRIGLGLVQRFKRFAEIALKPDAHAPGLVKALAVARHEYTPV